MATDLLEADDDAPLVRRGWRAIPDRLRGLHADRRGQILPLIFFLGVAFFTSVLLVVNTGRAVNFRIENQNAVDAAAVSGATSMARGMNYLASNNIAQARLLSVVIVLRAIPKATQLGLKTLKIWETVVIPAMQAAAQALKASPWTAPIGVALDIAAKLLKIKVKLEKIILNAIDKVINKGFKWFDKGISDQTTANLRKKPKGLAWSLMRGMSLLGQGLAYWGPVVSQYTAQVVYRSNLSDAGGFGFALLMPVYPGMPVCKAGFARFQPPLADEPTEFVPFLSDKIVLAGWVVLTLSFWPLYFQAGINYQMKALFQTSATQEEDGGCPTDFAEQLPAAIDFDDWDEDDVDLMEEDNCADSSPSWAGDRSDEDVERCRGPCREWWIKGKSKLVKMMQEALREKEIRRAQIGSDGIGLGVHNYDYKGELPYWEEAKVKAKAAKAEADADPDVAADEGHLGGHGTAIGETPEDDPATPPPPPDPVKVADDKIKELEPKRDALGTDDVNRWKIEGGEIPYWRKQRLDAETAIAANNAEIRTLRAVVRNSSGAAKTAAQARIDVLEGRNEGHQDAIDEADEKLPELIEEDGELKEVADDLEAWIEELTDHIEELSERSTEPPDGAPPETSVTAENTSARHDLDKKYYPYLLNVPDGAWPRTFTVFVVAGRGSTPPLGSADRFFGIYDEAFKNKMPVGFTYASARVLSPKAADLWISNWRAKLVRADAEHFPKLNAELLGAFPGPCDNYPNVADESTPGSAPRDRVTQDTTNTGSADDPASDEDSETMRQKIAKVLNFFSKH